jgi:hypothetical protein
MPTDTFAISSAANDGSCYKQGSTWPPTTFAVDDGVDQYATKIKIGSTYFADVSCLRFDTSSIPDTATITAANLLIDVIAKADDDTTFSLVGEYYDFGGEPSDSTDWKETASPQILSVDIGSITAGAVNSIPLTDLSGINKTGITGIRLTLSAGTPTGQNGVHYAAQEHTTRQEARLEVTYTVAGGGAVTRTFSLLGVGS